MFELNENTIKELSGAMTYEKGLALYNQNNVIEINASSTEKSEYEINIIDIKALVKSDLTNDKEYKIGIGFNDKSGIMHYKCDCVSYISGYSSGICEHITAALLKFNFNKDNILRESRYIDTLSLIDEIKNNNLKINLNNKEIKLEVKFEININKKKSTYMELKVKNEKIYVVKNLRKFIEVIYEKKGNIEFGKGFTFNYYEYFFNETDSKILKLLMEIYEIAKLTENIYYPNISLNKKMFIDGKKVFLTDIQLIRLLEILKNEFIEISIDGNSFSRVVIKEENFPINLYMDCNESDIILEQLSTFPIKLTTEEGYFFYENMIYKTNENQLDNYLPFYNAFNNSKGFKLYFDIKDKEKFADYILPSIKKIEGNLEIVESLYQNISEEPLKVSIYLDRFKDEITANVKFIYGDIIIDAVNNIYRNNDKKFIVRNLNEESNIISLIISFGFYEANGLYKFTEEEEKIYELFSYGINILKEVADIYYSEELKKIKIYKNMNYKANIRINDEKLLEFSFNIDSINKEDLKGIFKELKKKKKYYKLKNGDMIDLNLQEFHQLGNLIETLDIKEMEFSNGKALISGYNAVYIDDYLTANSISFVNREETFIDFVKKIKQPNDWENHLPKDLNDVMRNYQKSGFYWLKKLSSCGFGGILADEMGLGKTIQTIAFIESEVENHNNPCLIIVPSSLLYNWQSEIEKFAPLLKSIIITGTKDIRNEKIKQIKEFNIVITSYPLIRRDIEEYLALEFSYCILDEAQQIKNPGSINAQFVKQLKAKGYFALTGTPIENSLSELWSIFDFIMPGYLFSYSKFVKKYEGPIIKNNDVKLLEELNKRVAPFILRRLKRDVIKELPPKIEHMITIEMTDEQKIIYMAYLNEAKEILEFEINENGFNKSKIKILALLTRLRQICCDPSIFIEDYIGESGKMLALDELIEESLEAGHRILIFSQFTSVLKNIKVRLIKSNINFMYLDGRTKPFDRMNLVNDFNNGNSGVFLISLKAGGTGLNLTGADVVIHFDPWWNPAVEDQATDRAHRIGQNKTVEVIKLVTRGSIEEKIYNIQIKKKKIIGSVLNKNNDESNILSNMTEEQLVDIFNFS